MEFSEIIKYEAALFKKTYTSYISKITKLVLHKNATTNFCIWFEIIGHVSCVSVKIAKSKKDYNNILFNSDMIFLDLNSYHHEDVLISLEKIVKKLEELK
jgi:hypothetical protein